MEDRRGDRLAGIGSVAGDNGDGDEGFGLADRARFLELDEIPDLELVIGIMCLILLLLADTTLILRVRCEADDFHGHGLVVGGAHHAALELLHRLDGDRRGSWRRIGGRGDGKFGKKRNGAIEERRTVGWKRVRAFEE